MYQIHVDSPTQEAKENRLVVGRITFNNVPPEFEQSIDFSHSRALTPKELADHLSRKLGGNLEQSLKQDSTKQLRDRVVFLEKELERYKLLYAKSRRKIKELNHV